MLVLRRPTFADNKLFYRCWRNCSLQCHNFHDLMFLRPLLVCAMDNRTSDLPQFYPEPDMGWVGQPNFYPEFGSGILQNFRNFYPDSHSMAFSKILPISIRIRQRPPRGLSGVLGKGVYIVSTDFSDVNPFGCRGVEASPWECLFLIYKMVSGWFLHLSPFLRQQCNISPPHPKLVKS